MTSARKTADDWFDEYSVCHQNHVNKLVHWVCVPLIALSVIALFWSIPVPAALADQSPWLNFGTLIVALSLLFYFVLSPALALGMVAFSAICIGIIRFYESAGFGPVWQAALGVFVVAWIGQFIGHRIEGKKPAFFKDLQYLLIGPAWLLGFVYRRFGIRY